MDSKLADKFLVNLGLQWDFTPSQKVVWGECIGPSGCHDLFIDSKNLLDCGNCERLWAWNYTETNLVEITNG